MDVGNLFNEAKKLPDRDRADLASRLIESLDPEFDEDTDAAWIAEVDRRLAEFDRGERKTLTWPEFRRRIMREQ